MRSVRTVLLNSAHGPPIRPKQVRVHSCGRSWRRECGTMWQWGCSTLSKRDKMLNQPQLMYKFHLKILRSFGNYGAYVLDLPKLVLLGVRNAVSFAAQGPKEDP